MFTCRGRGRQKAQPEPVAWAIGCPYFSQIEIFILERDMIGCPIAFTGGPVLQFKLTVPIPPVKIRGRLLLPASLGKRDHLEKDIEFEIGQ